MAQEIRVIEGSVPLTFTLNVKPATPARQKSLRFTFNVNPVKDVFEPSVLTSNSTLVIEPIQLDLKTAIMDAVKTQISGQIDNFFDVDRAAKTVLNFGEDFQSLMVNWKLSEEGENRFLGKLYTPLPEEVDEGSELFISREIAYPLIDQAYVLVLDPLGVRIYLRPPNKSIEVYGLDGKTVAPTNMEGLLSSGAFDPVNPSDRLVEEWFTTALEGAELNVDYSNYHNFIFFSSAENRLRAFRNKLAILEDLNNVITRNSSSLSLITGSVGGLESVTASVAYPSIVNLTEQRQELIRSFDPYEQFLFYETEIPFSGTFVEASFNDEWDKEFYLEDVTWPKVSGTPVSVTSSLAQTWFDDQLDVARIYDNWNINRLVNNIPEYLRNDPDSEEFRRFLDMVGHMYDTVKLYIDHMSDIFDRGNNPLDGLSKDLVWDVAKAYGVDLPNQYAVENALRYTRGDDSKVFRVVASETWRRFLHNQIFLMKTKGTRESLRSLMNVYGVLPSTVQIRETSTPSLFFASQSFESFEEQSAAVRLLGSQNIEIPWVPTGSNEPELVLMRFRTSVSGVSQTILDADGDWQVRLNPTDDEYYTIEAWAGGSPQLVTSELPLGNGEFYSIMISGDGSMRVMKINSINEIEEDIHLTGSATLESEWLTPNTLFVGAEDGSPPSSGLIGNIDEVRVWGENISDRVFELWAQYPGTYHGNTPSSAIESLWARLSFNRIKNLGTTGSLANDSPYQRTDSAPVSMDEFTVNGFDNIPDYPHNYDVFSRFVRRMAPSGGGIQYDNNKIKIVDPPELKFIGDTMVPVLSRHDSIVPLSKKEEEQVKSNNVIGFYFSITNYVNDSIVRSLGEINIHDLIGDPSDQFRDRYEALDDLNKLYWDNYSYNIDTNKFVDFVRDLLGPMFKQAEKLVPARSKILTGMVVEPNILQRNKVKSRPVIREELDLEASPETTEPSILGIYDDLHTLIRHEEEYDIVSDLLDQKGIIDTREEDIIFADTSDYVAHIEEGIDKKIFADYISLIGSIQEEDIYFPFAELLDLSTFISLDDDVYTRSREVFIKAVETGSIFTDSVLSPVIIPADDFDTDPLGSTQFFTHPDGFVAVATYQRRQYRGGILVDQGEWVQGDIYNTNDVVIQPDVSDPAATPGSGSEFYAIRDNFISNTPPYLDPVSWRKVGYVADEVFEIKKAVVIDDKLTLVSTGSAEPAFLGYRPNHYRFFRPTNTGHIRSRYTGVVQTNETTPDGEPAIVITRSGGDRLVVVDPDAPIQRPDPESGPVLDVE